MDGDKTTVAADTPELLMMSQIAIHSAMEELSLWTSQYGTMYIHESAMAALQTHQLTDAINVGIERLHPKCHVAD